MWAIIKIDKQNFQLIKKSMEDKLGEKIDFFIPWFKIQNNINSKIKYVNLIGNYAFCYSDKFQNINVLNFLRYTKGLKYFLSGFQNNQIEISKFIKKCKEFQHKTNSLSENLYDLKINEYYKFCEGPFSQKIFKLIGLDKKIIRILIGKIETTIKADNYLVLPV